MTQSTLLHKIDYNNTQTAKNIEQLLNSVDVIQPQPTIKQPETQPLQEPQPSTTILHQQFPQPPNPLPVNDQETFTKKLFQYPELTATFFGQFNIQKVMLFAVLSILFQISPIRNSIITFFLRFSDNLFLTAVFIGFIHTVLYFIAEKSIINQT